MTLEMHISGKLIDRKEVVSFQDALNEVYWMYLKHVNRIHRGYVEPEFYVRVKSKMNKWDFKIEEEKITLCQ